MGAVEGGVVRTRIVITILTLAPASIIIIVPNFATTAAGEIIVLEAPLANRAVVAGPARIIVVDNVATVVTFDSLGINAHWAKHIIAAWAALPSYLGHVVVSVILVTTVTA